MNTQLFRPLLGAAIFLTQHGAMGGQSPDGCPGIITVDMLREDADINAIRMLLRRGASPHVSDKVGYSPIYIAVHFDNPVAADIVHLLLQHGADPDAISIDGLSVVDVAASNGSAETMRHLLDHGGNPMGSLRGGAAAVERAALRGNASAFAAIWDSYYAAEDPGEAVRARIYSLALLGAPDAAAFSTIATRVWTDDLQKVVVKPIDMTLAQITVSLANREQWEIARDNLVMANMAARDWVVSFDTLLSAPRFCELYAKTVLLGDSVFAYGCEALAYRAGESFVPAKVCDASRVGGIWLSKDDPDRQYVLRFLSAIARIEADSHVHGWKLGASVAGVEGPAVDFVRSVIVACSPEQDAAGILRALQGGVSE